MALTNGTSNSTYLDVKFPVLDDGMDVNEKLNTIVNYLELLKEAVQHGMRTDESALESVTDSLQKGYEDIHKTVENMGVKVDGMSNTLNNHVTVADGKISILSRRTKQLASWTSNTWLTEDDPDWESF